jgi:hypothetical protein
MARTVTARASSSILATLSNTVDGASAGASVLFDPTLLSIAWASGTGADQCNTAFADDGTLATVTNLDVDIFDNGAANDALGVAIANTKLKLLLFKNTTAYGVDCKFTLGGQSIGTTAFNSIFNGSDTAEIGPITPGGVIMIALPDANGATVTDATNHVLRIRNTGATSGTYSYLILGVQ